MGINREQVRKIFEKEPEKVRTLAKMLQDSNLDGEKRRFILNVFRTAQMMGFSVSQYLV